MRDFLLVLKFELQTMVRKKSFLISTVLVAAAAFVLLSIPRVFSNDKGTDDTASEKDKTMLIYDGSGILKNRELAEKNFPEFQISYANSLSEVEEKVKKSEADAGFEVKTPTSFQYYVNNSSLNDANSSRFKTLLQQQYQASELAKLKYDAGKVQAIYQTEVISDTTVLGTDGMNNYFYTYVLILVLYMMILIYGNQIGVGVASEKSNRAIEILTTSCSPNALIFGKVIAGAIAGVVQTAIMLGSFLIAYQLNADVWDHMLDKFLDIPGLVLVTFALFGILGYLLFSFLFGAIGALCSKVEEVNGATMPIQLLIIAVFIISFITLQNPDTLLAKIMCYVPFSSWMCMFINVAMGSVSTMEIVISLALLAATTVAMGLLGARLYRRGTLSYGNSVKLKAKRLEALSLEYIMYAFLAMVLLMLLWALRLWYRMHQEETVYAVYKKSDYIFCAAFLLLGILNLYDERRLQYGSILMALGILYGMRRSGISQHNLYVDGRRIPLQPGKLITQKEQDGCLQLYYELGVHYGTLNFSIDKKEQITQILKNQGY